MIATLFAASVALVTSALALLGAVIFGWRLRLPAVRREGSVTLVMPLTGEVPGLERLLGALEAQSLLPRRLVVAVESTEDPAHGRTLALAAGRRFPIRVVVAGPAERCAQKCTNLIAALGEIDSGDDAVVLMDADILPPPWWLSALVSPLMDGTADLVNGYRWPMVAAPTLGAHLAAAVDRAIALLPRLGSLRLTWGGSLALSPRAVAVLDLGHILATTLSDDCTIGEHAASRGLRVLNRRSLLVPTPTGGGLTSVWRFGRRQYQIIHTYRPALWWMTFVVLSIRVAAWGLLLIHVDWPAARLAALALIAIAIGGLGVQIRVAQRLGLADGPRVRLVQVILALLKPVVDLFHWSLVAAAAAAGTVRWGHVTYRVTGPCNIAIRSRVPWV